MRAALKLKFDNVLKLPIQYNYIIQAVILKWLGDENYKKFIHDTGFQYNNRSYKMYTFSRLEGKFQINKADKTISYFDEAKLTIAAEDSRFLNYLVNNVICNDEINFLDNKVYIDEITCSNRKLISGERIYTKSPISVYSTFEIEGRKKTYYYSPYETDYQRLLKNNLINKYNAINGIPPENDDFNINPVNKSRLKENVVIYKGTVIKGWSGEFILEGCEELLNIAYNSGLGSKNGQGFGCIEICNH